MYNNRSKHPFHRLLKYLLLINLGLFPLSLLIILSEDSNIKLIIYYLRVCLVLGSIFVLILSKPKIAVNFFVLIVPVFISLVLFFNKVSIDFFTLYFLALCFYNLPHCQTEIIRKSSHFYLYFCAFISLCSYIDFLPTYKGTDYMGIYSNSFCLIHPNYFMFFLFYSFTGYLILNNKKLKYITLVFIIIFYQYTWTRTILYLGIISIFWDIYRYKPFKINIYRIIPYLLSFVTFFIAIFYENILDFLLNNGNLERDDHNLFIRVMDIKNSLKIIFGNYETALFGGVDIKMDSLYINLLGGLGTVSTMLIVFFLIKETGIQIKKKNFDALFVVLSFIILGIFEYAMYSTTILSIYLISLIYQSGRILS